MTEPPLLIDHRRLVNNEHSYPDVFIVADEKNTFVAHSFILLERIPLLFEDNNNNLLKKKKIKKKKNIIIELNKTEQITPEAIQRLLTYAYSSYVDLKTLTPFKAVELMKLSVSFKVEHLSQICHKYLQSSINIDNIFKLLKLTDSINVERAKQICMEFALSNADFFTSASAESLGFKLYQEVTTTMLKAQNQKQQQQNNNNEIQVTEEDTITEDFKKIYHSDPSKDFTIVIQNEEVKAHKAILIDQSPELTYFISRQETEQKECNTAAIKDATNATSTKDLNKDLKRHTVTTTLLIDQKYPTLSVHAFEAMLRFFYYSSQDMSLLNACQLYFFARDMNLSRLCSLIEKVISTEEITVTTALPLLDVAFSPSMSESVELQKKLKENGLKFVIQNVDKIDFLPLQNMASQIGTQILQHLQFALAICWRNMVRSGTPQTILEATEGDDTITRSLSSPNTSILDIQSIHSPKSVTDENSGMESEQSKSARYRDRSRSRSKSRKEGATTKKKKNEK